MVRLRKTLPDGISDLLSGGDLEQISTALSRCEIGARSRDYSRITVLHLTPCSDEVVRWLVERGEDINAEDRFGNRPLHCRVVGKEYRQIPLLLELGADVDAASHNGVTPLLRAASYCSLEAIDILLDSGADATKRKRGWSGDEYSAIYLALSREPPPLHALNVIERLIAAGACPTGAEAPLLREMSKDHQRVLAKGLRSERITEVGRAIDRLFEICGVDPVAPIQFHDGISPIVVPAGSWKKAFRALWDSLVPFSGRAKTAQGEAIRISGRISYEILHNGGGNWDRAYEKLVDGLSGTLGSGVSLPAGELAEVRQHLAALRQAAYDEYAIDRVSELAVAWVRLNPSPIPNPLPDVGR